MRITEDEYRRLIRKAGAAPLYEPKASVRSDLEVEMERRLNEAGIAMLTDHRPINGRNFELDFAIPQLKVGFECDGGVHRIKGRFKADIERHNLLVLEGWRVLRGGRAEIFSGKAIEQLALLIKKTRGPR